MASVDITRVRGGIATVEMHGPRANAMNEAFLTDLRAAFQEVARDDRVRGVILTGKERAFSAGLDLRAVVETGQVPGSFTPAMEQVFTLPKPVVAAVNGHAIAGGCVLMLAADRTILAEGEYSIGLTELDIGVPFPPIAFEIVRLALPSHNLPRLLYDAQLMLPEEAFAYDMGHELTPPEELMDAAEEWLGMVTARPPATFALTKRWLRAEALERARGRSREDLAEVDAAMRAAETQRRIREMAARLKK